MTAARLMLAGGSGRLVRRPSVVLFDPTGQNLDLAARFDAAESDSDAVDGLKKYLIESGFTAAPLVVAEWQRDDFNLLVFGDIEVHTSAAAAPMVSGMGSSTWVERRLGAIELGAATTVEVWSGAAADPTTNLGLGVVACAGFRMSLDFAELGAMFTQGAPTAGEVADEGVAVAAVAEDRGGHTIRTVPVAPLERLADSTVSAQGQSGESVGRPVASVAPAPAAVIEPIASPTVAVDDTVWVDTDDVPAQVDAPTDQASSPTASTAATPVDPAEVDPFTTGAPPAASHDATGPAAAASDAASPTADFDDDHSMTEAAPLGAAVADPFGSQGSIATPRAGLIEAAYCPTGHPNPPRGAACYVCGLSLVEDQSLGLIEQPAVGRIAFAGGQQLSLERAIAMGRKPDAESVGAHPVLIDHVEVSRSHAVITIEGWTVLLTDQGSRNGTWVVPPSDRTPVRLDDGVPHVLEHGTAVHLGAPEVSFTYYFDA